MTSDDAASEALRRAREMAAAPGFKKRKHRRRPDTAGTLAKHGPRVPAS